MHGIIRWEVEFVPPSSTGRSDKVPPYVDLTETPFYIEKLSFVAKPTRERTVLTLTTYAGEDRSTVPWSVVDSPPGRCEACT